MVLGNMLASEALPGALPREQNNPQICPYGLYAEQLNISSFTKARALNRFAWLYRTLPSAALRTTKFSPLSLAMTEDAQSLQVDPEPGRWGPFAPGNVAEVDFIRGLRVVAGAGNPSMCEGLRICMYAFAQPMDSTAFSSADGDWLIVPQHGTLRIRTEFGVLDVEPTHIAVIPRMVRFSVSSMGGEARGYCVEVFNEGGFRLPELGPLGANGLANPAHFQAPQASVLARAANDNGDAWTHVFKTGDRAFEARGLCPFNVAAWKGSLFPVSYDLKRFTAVNSVSVDHSDPSIFTVLSVASAMPGTSACDFVVFPHRWMVAEHTFRPPFFHQNVMSEFMGLINGEYDGKKQGFLPGGMSLHARGTPHGPDVGVFEQATKAKLEPHYFAGGLAFMFETCFHLAVSAAFRAGQAREVDYRVNAWGRFAEAKL